ncbi:DUF6090 family protein [Robiginitalea sp. SC105]|uniref:DUF6090 family protein n=1 Tax=Robiginitalea sp. SC105 TaxID=2762332 RepID=UPI00163A32C4|nr:DUF6090 family protein [Robiginitalea sp. SC105]MBC2839856.1 hypothetical protein [Robiginitalea sp. SC105]
MLRFFRQLRRRLLTDNKFSKYLLYAVGEILLVVFGILIALQVDNWNEAKKEESLYITYLSRLKSDCENLLETVRYTKLMQDEIVALNKYQLDFINGNLTPLDTFKLAVSIEFTAGINPYSLEIPVYSELENTGRLTLIESDSLKQALAGFQEYKNFRLKNNLEWEPWVFKYRAMVRNILNAEDRIRINEMWSIPLDSSFVSKSWFNAYFDNGISGDFALKTNKERFTTDLLESEELPGLVADIYIAQRITQGLLVDEESNILNLIRLIQGEVDRLSD